MQCVSGHACMHVCVQYVWGGGSVFLMTTNFGMVDIEGCIEIASKEQDGHRGEE